MPLTRGKHPLRRNVTGTATERLLREPLRSFPACESRGPPMAGAFLPPPPRPPPLFPPPPPPPAVPTTPGQPDPTRRLLALPLEPAPPPSPLSMRDGARDPGPRGQRPGPRPPADRAPPRCRPRASRRPPPV